MTDYRIGLTPADRNGVPLIDDTSAHRCAPWTA